MNLVNFLKTNYDTINGESYYDLMFESFLYFKMDTNKILENFNNRKTLNDISLNPFNVNKEHIYDGTYTLRNIIGYHNIRNGWRVAENSKDMLISNCASDLLSKGYHIVKIDTNDEFVIPKYLELKLFIKYILQGGVFHNVRTDDKYNNVLAVVKKMSRLLYQFDDEIITGNVQVNYSAKDPISSWAPEIYDFHFDIGYPNLKFFYNIHDLTELNGPYEYVPTSNIVSYESICFQIAAAMYKQDRDSTSKTPINTVSEFYTNAGTKNYFDLKDDIYKREVIKFSLPKNHLVVTDNSGYHRKTQGVKGIKNKRLYFHPVPYPRENRLHFELP